MAERTLPSAGALSPCDFYLDPAERSLGFFYSVDRATGAGARRTVEINMIYDPASSGSQTPMGVSAKLQYAASAAIGGGSGWAVQAQLDFLGGATIDSSSGIFSALRAVITASDTPVFTNFDTICGLYIDNLCATNMSTGGHVDLIKVANHAAGTIDNVLHTMCSTTNPISNFLYVEGVAGFMSGGAASGSAAKIQMKWGATTYYINIYQ